MGVMKELSSGGYSKKLKAAYRNPQAMVGISVDMFFRPDRVMRAIDQASYDALRSGGAMIRKTAQRSMRKVKDPDKASPPGQPPRAHEGRLRRSIVYGYDDTSESVVVGPASWMGKAEVPALHEFGGVKSVPRREDPTVIYPGKFYQFFNGRPPFTIKSMAEARAIAKYYNKKERMRKGKLRRHYKVASGPRQVGGKRSVYPARPYMEPALNQMIPRLAAEFPKTFGDAWNSPL